MQLLSSGKVKRSESDWRKLYDRYVDSGVSINQFCRDEGVASSSFRKWLYKFSGTSPSSRVSNSNSASFVDLTPKSKEPLNLVVELSFSKGMTFRILG